MNFIGSTLLPALNPAGGVLYHWQAMRYKNRLWPHFKNEILEWLSGWPQKSDQLLLIGPSAGYSLSSDWLNRYERIHALDPDPLAKMLFKSSDKKSLVWYLNSPLNFEGSREDSGMEELQKRFPNMDILFCNFLGQVGFLASAKWRESCEAQFKPSLNQYLQNKNWASYHDLYSLPLSRNTKRQALPKNFQVQDLSSYVESLPQKVELQQHLPQDFFENSSELESQFFWWQRTPHYAHIIQGLRPS